MGFNGGGIQYADFLAQGRIGSIDNADLSFAVRDEIQDGSGVFAKDILGLQFFVEPAVFQKLRGNLSHRRCFGITHGDAAYRRNHVSR